MGNGCLPIFHDLGVPLFRNHLYHCMIARHQHASQAFQQQKAEREARQARGELATWMAYAQMVDSLRGMGFDFRVHIGARKVH